MELKITGAEFNEFYNDPSIWGDASSEIYHDDVLITRNGAHLPDDFDYANFEATDQLVVKSGYIVYPENGTDKDFQAAIQEWRKTRDTETFNVSCPKELTEVIKAAIKSAGGKIN